MTDQSYYTINQAAQDSGLSTGVLRVWEARYGWPLPKRSTNGYRVFSRPQIAELKRASALVKSGLPVSKLIIDGYPRWPAGQVSEARVRLLPHCRALAVPERDAAARLQSQMIDALEQAHSGRVRELVQAACIELRPLDEIHAALVPALVGIAELRQQGRALADGAEIAALVGERCRQLGRRYASANAGLAVIPTAAAATPLAELATLLLNLRGLGASRLPAGTALDGQRVVLVDDADGKPVASDHPCVTALPGDDRIAVAGLVTADVSVLEHIGLPAAH